MRKRSIAVLILFSSMASGAIVGFLSEEGNIDFSFDAVSIYSIREETQILKLYLKIPHKNLLFTKTDSGYNASFEITAIAYDEKGNQIGGDTRLRSHTIPSYEATLLRSESLIDSLLFPLPEGEYKMKIVVKDLHSKNQGTRTVELLTPRIPIEHVSLSELSLLKDGTPAVKNNFKPQDEVEIVYQIYNFPLILSNTSRAIIKREKKRTVLWDSRSIYPDSVKTEKCELDLSQFKRGNYQISISIISEDGRIVDEKTKSFHIEISPLLDDEYFREAINQLQYIATNEEIKRLKKAKPEDRESEWNSFWKEKDPTPSTETNEFKEEYYRRIEYANAHYGGTQKGWRTDRGKIYIIYGPPDEIERYPYELHSMPYEIWYYYSRGLKFIFVDEHGIGDYRLLSPRGERW